MKQSGIQLKRIISVALIALLSASLSGCGSLSDSADPKIEITETAETSDAAVTEETSDSVQIPESAETPSRVIAISKSNAELWILAGGSLIATTEDALKTEGLSDDIVSLGDMDHVSLEAVTALEPQLVILFSTDPSQKALGEALEDIGISVYYTNIDNFSDYEEVMGDFTELTGREDLYKSNVLYVREDIDRITGQLPDEAKDDKTYLLLHVSATKSKVEKNDYFACEIFNNLGLANIASDSSSFDELSIEQIISSDPDYIFVVPRGDETKAMASFEELFTSDPSWETLSAVKNEEYYLLSKDLFGLKPNNRWAESYKEAYKLIYEK